MIVRLKGPIIYKKGTEVAVDCGGVGYAVSAPLKVVEQLPPIGKSVELKTLLVHREDSMTLYGFLEDSEKAAFTELTSISGIGPKMALGILSAASVDELRSLILSENLIALKKLPGIGKKTAERLILELKDKFAALPGESVGVDSADSSVAAVKEAVAALVALGFNAATAGKAVSKAAKEAAPETPGAERLIKRALSLATK